MTKSSMGSPNASLPEAWVIRIFEHMACCYGTKFTGQWAGQDPETLRAFWGRKLAGFVGRPEAIRAALDEMDDRPFPPTLPEFLGMCRDAARRLPQQCSALPAPDPGRIPDQVIGVAKAMSPPSFAPSSVWAVRIRDRYHAGDRLEAIQVAYAQDALGEKFTARA